MAERPSILCTFTLAGMLTLAGCGSSSSPTTQSLTFSDVKVACDNREGFFGGRYANFEVTGSVTNDTENPVNEDNMPTIESEGGDEFEPRLSQDKLLPGETCDISYKGELGVNDGETPKLSFVSKLEVTGLEEATAKLSEGISEAVGEFAAKDEEKEQKEAAKEEARKAIENGRGMTAKEALETAKEADLSYDFVDANEVDVTDSVVDAKEGSEILGSKVTDVEIDGGFFGDTAIFTLDYVDKEAEEKEEARKAVENIKGGTAEEALAAAKTAGYKYDFIDANDVNVTSSVNNAKDRSEILESKVVDVDLKTSFFGGTKATFTLDYVDKVAAERKKAEEKKRKEQEEKQKEDRKAIEACKGKTAKEAIELAKDADFHYWVCDAKGNAISLGYDENKLTDEILGSKVTDIKFSNGYGSTTVELMLDYVDKEEEAREKAKEEEKKAKEAAQKAVEDIKGKTADEALKAANDAGYHYSFHDKYGSNVRHLVDDASNGSDIHAALVAEVNITKGFFGDVTADFTLDYVGPEAAEAQRREELLKTAVGRTAAEVMDAAKASGMECIVKDPNGSEISRAYESEYAPSRSRAIVADSALSGKQITITLDRPLAITAEDSQAFADVLYSQSEYADIIPEFVKSHKGMNIEFDGYVATYNTSGSGETIFDILIYVGDSNSGVFMGPLFQFHGVNLNSDLHWTGGMPDYIAENMNLHIVARVDEWTRGDLFRITPVQTFLK